MEVIILICRNAGYLVVEILQDVDYSWLFSVGGLIILGFDSFINTPCLHMFCNAQKRQSIPLSSKKTLCT